ncbi:MAG: hypothetical protein ACOZNI_34970 [Myxococcota bacterium]
MAVAAQKRKAPNESAAATQLAEQTPQAQPRNASRGNQYAQERMLEAQARDARGEAAKDEALFPPMSTILATTYDTRLAAVDEVGRRYPGLDAGEEVDDEFIAQLGVFAGAHLQTRWQEQSGRGDNMWWSTLNYSLTIVPNRIAAEYASERTARLRKARTPKLQSTSLAVEKITEDHVREAWKTYFEVSDRHLAHDHGWSILGIRIGGDDLPSAQEAYWVAHILSLKYAEHHYKADLEKKPPPPVEAEFRSAWWAMVELLDEVNFSTKAGFSELALSLTMPQHLLKDPKAVEDLPLTQEAFVRLLIATRRATVTIQGWLD